jgi:RHS repeat-associated protein
MANTSPRVATESSVCTRLIRETINTTGYTYTGLDYADQRYYASTYGRFNTPDPYAGSFNSRNPLSWNRYLYTLGDPGNRNDPRGLDGSDTDCTNDPWDCQDNGPIGGVGPDPGDPPPVVYGNCPATAANPQGLANPDGSCPDGSGGGTGATGGSGFTNGSPSWGSFAKCYGGGLLTATNTDFLAGWVTVEAAYWSGTPWGVQAVIVARIVALVSIDSTAGQVAQACAILTGYIPWRLQIQGFVLPSWSPWYNYYYGAPPLTPIIRGTAPPTKSPNPIRDPPSR